MTKEFDKLTSDFPFLDYATCFWGVHAALCFVSEAKTKMNRLLSNPTLTEFWSQRFEYRQDHWRQFNRNLNNDEFLMACTTKSISALHIAARFGVEILVREILSDKEADSNICDSLGHTPLMFAAASGQKGTLHILVSRDNTLINQTDHQGKTATQPWDTQSKTDRLTAFVYSSPRTST
jgi:hypothetical protein